MFKLIIRRLFLGLLTLLAITVLVFLGTEILPGDVAQAILGQSATPETVAALREKLGLNAPPWERYFTWLANILAGDLGNSLANGIAVDRIIGQRIVNTLNLALYAAVIALPLSLLLGLLSAAWPEGTFDRTTSSTTVFFISIPDFVIAIVLIIIFARELGWFPSVVHRPRWGDVPVALGQTFLPMLTLVLTILAHIIRMTRAAVLDVLKQPYIEMALLKGAPKSRIIIRHAIPNALGPIVNVVALNLAYLVSGVVIVEVIFTYPGLGRLMVDSVIFRDLPLIQVAALVFCGFYVALNITADVTAIMANPRLRFAK
ncbi:MAG: ABC transporter permease [Alphaproteobacteria bacterium]|nr:ABC transporter permease [Alphaproteobacteria bacterium]